ncbi:GPI inositol deacylase [Tilletia horrida]|nr:GPI inositol deacylase [Tilletia horrida]
MSRMWPAYAAHHDFPSPSGLNQKYSLFLYRERGPHGHPPDDQPRGVPALFIPGNAGHYAQIRSVASSCATQYYTGDGRSTVKPEWGRSTGDTEAPIDWWTVHFNEDFSAFHAQTMIDQATFINEVIAYLQTLYPGQISSVPILAHSMGGIVARLALLQPNYNNASVNTIITLSTPHVFPPAPFDRGIESIYKLINDRAKQYAGSFANWPRYDTEGRRMWPYFADLLLISIGSGALDNQITSESSTLSMGAPTISSLMPGAHAISTFTSALPGLWCSVGHVSMVWCDQLRARIARGVMLDSSLFSPGKSRKANFLMAKRKALWKRVLGADAEWGDYESLENSTDLSLHQDVLQRMPGASQMGYWITNPPLNSDNVQPLIFDVNPQTHSTQDSDSDFELVTDLSVGTDSTLGLGVLAPNPMLVIYLCKSNAQTPPTECFQLPAAAFALIPNSPFNPTLSQATEYSPSILFPHAETSYELPHHGMRRWTAKVEELRQKKYQSIWIDRRYRASSITPEPGFVKAGFVNREPIVVLSKSKSADALSSVILDVASALSSIRSKSSSSSQPTNKTIAPALHFHVPSMDSSLLAYRINIQAASTPSECPSTADRQLLFSPMLLAQHKGTGDAVWFPSLLESLQNVGDVPAGYQGRNRYTVAHQDRLRMSLYASSPFVPPASDLQKGTHFTLFLDTMHPIAGVANKCAAALANGGIESVTISVDWRLSLGLLAMRYRFGALVFAFAMLALLSGLMWNEWNQADDVNRKATSLPRRNGHRRSSEEEEGALLEGETVSVISASAPPDRAFPSLWTSLWFHGSRLLLIMSVTFTILALLQSFVINTLGPKEAYQQGFYNWLLGFPGPASFSSIALGPALLLAAFSVLILQVCLTSALVWSASRLLSLFVPAKSARGQDEDENDYDEVAKIRTANAERTLGYSRTTLIGIASIVVAVLFALPYQLVFLVATLVQLVNAARSRNLLLTEQIRQQQRSTSSTRMSLNKAVTHAESRYNQQVLILTLMMAVLPIRAPVLLVWGRNLLLGVRAPATTPFYGDHNALEIMSFILIVQIGTSGRILQRSPNRVFAKITQMLFSIVAIKSLTWGLRYTYLLFDGLNVLFAWLLFVQLRTRCLGLAGQPGAQTPSQLLPQRNIDLANISGSEQQGVEENKGLISEQRRSKLADAWPASESTSTSTGRAVHMPISHMDIPPELAEVASVLPPSLATTADLTEKEITNQSGKSGVEEEDANSSLDDLVGRYLNLAAEYHHVRTQAGKHLAQGHIDLARARMQIGGWNLAKLGRDGYDARLTAQTQVQAQTSRGESSRLIGFVRLKAPDDVDEVEPYLIEEPSAPPSTLRQRRKQGVLDEVTVVETEDEKAEEEDKKGHGASQDLSEPPQEMEKEKKKRTLLPPDPLYQFAALPPPSLRSAKTNFESALGLLIGTDAKNGRAESTPRDVLTVIMELNHVQAAIDRLRGRL